MWLQKGNGKTKTCPIDGLASGKPRCGLWVSGTVTNDTMQAEGCRTHWAAAGPHDDTERESWASLRDRPQVVSPQKCRDWNTTTALRFCDGISQFWGGKNYVNWNNCYLNVLSNGERPRKAIIKTSVNGRRLPRATLLSFVSWGQIFSKYT